MVGEFQGKTGGQGRNDGSSSKFSSSIRTRYIDQSMKQEELLEDRNREDLLLSTDLFSINVHPFVKYMNLHVPTQNQTFDTRVSTKVRY